MRKPEDHRRYDDRISMFARRWAEGSNQNRSNAKISSQKPYFFAVMQGKKGISRWEMHYDKLSVSIEYYLTGDLGHNNIRVER